MKELRVAPKFRDKIPPLTQEEFKQLEENILNDGEVYEPITVWNGVIVDGHNRWKIIQAHPDIPYRVREMDFPDEWAAYDWMYSKQLGRRNLTESQRLYMIGKKQEARKNTHGGDRKSSDHFGHLITGRSRKAIADELGVSEGTVQRAEKYAKGIDAIKGISQDAANAVLNGEYKTTKKSIRELANANHEQVQESVRAIENHEPLPEITQPTETELEPVEREPYNITDLVNEIIENGEDLEHRLRMHIRMRLSYAGGKECRGQVADAVGEIIKNLNNFKEEILNGDVSEQEFAS